MPSVTPKIWRRIGGRWPRKVALVSAAVLTLGLISLPAAEADTPSLKVFDKFVTERDYTFSTAVPVRLDAPRAWPVRVSYWTVNGSAVAGHDYLYRSGTKTFWPGQTTKWVRVPIMGGAAHEDTEFFKVRINRPFRPWLDPLGIVTIFDNDPAYVPPPEPELPAAESLGVWNGDTGAAFTIPGGSDLISPAGDEDWYRFTLHESNLGGSSNPLDGELVVDPDSTLDARICLYELVGSGLSLIDCEDDFDADFPESIPFEIPDTGGDDTTVLYYLVDGWSTTTGWYDHEIDMNP